MSSPILTRRRHWTETAITELKWAGKDQRITVGDGLVLQLRRSSKTWLLRRQGKGRNRIQTLGRFPAMTLKEARKEAALAFDAGDPTNMTVKQLAKKFQREVVEPRQRSATQVEGYIRRGLVEPIGHRRVASVTRADLVKLLRDYKETAGERGKGDGSRAADTLRSVMRRVFGYAVELGVIETNPLDGVTPRVTGFSYVARDRVLSPDEIRELWGWDHPIAALLRLLLLTGLRIGEAQKGHRDGDRWVVPVAHSKNRKPHWVHLTETAKSQLPLPSTSHSGGVQIWLRRQLGEERDRQERWTPHDLRRTAATLMNENGVDPFVVERVLNHTIRGVAGIYNRAEFEQARVEAAEILEQAVLAILEGESS